MKNKVTGLVALAFLLTAGTVGGQDSNYNFTVQTLGGYTTPGVVPFWLRSNQFGSIPLDGASLSLIGAARKDFDLSGDKLFDWGASFEGRANLGEGSNLTLIEGYGKVRLGIFELRAGRSKEITGLCDTTLSLGSFSISGNNLGIPKVEVVVREFFIVPGFGQLFALKGNFAHGWMGEASARMDGRNEDTVLTNLFYHQKSLYGRFGKPFWKFKLYGGFNNQAMWGNEEEYYNDDFTLSPVETYLYVITGKRFTNGYIQSTRLGNHVGSIDLGIEYEFANVKVLLYRQNFYDAGNLAYLDNIKDGLNGIVVEQRHANGKQFTCQKLLLELLYTKSQAGEPSSTSSGSAYEAYYNHYLYINGYSYLGNGLGTPFISLRTDIRDELPSAPQEYFTNNRVIALHFGCEGFVLGFDYNIKTSLSRNYGTYWTSDEEQSTNIPNPGIYGLFGVQDQFSAYLELNRELRNGLSVGFLGAIDYGELLYNSFGLFLKASYSFNL